MTSDGSQNASLGHDIAEGTKMTVVHVDTIAAQHEAELIYKAQAYSFNSKNSEDLLNVVGAHTSVINLLKTENFLECDTISFN